MQIILTKEEYEELLPNKLNNRFVDTFEDFMKNKQQFGDDSAVLIKELQSIFENLQNEQGKGVLPELKRPSAD